MAGLTGAANAAAGADAGAAEREARRRAAEDTRAPVRPREVLEGVRADFVENSYLWTGDITRDIFDEACRFTDPTLSFVGLRTFEKNMEGLTPWVERLVPRDTRECTLLSAELDEGARTVTARWRMAGDLVFGSRLDIEGETVFSYHAPARGGRVYAYDETWATPPAQALLQLVTPRWWPGRAPPRGE